MHAASSTSVLSARRLGWAADVIAPGRIATTWRLAEGALFVLNGATAWLQWVE